jgi:hypothetical protein
VTLIAFWKRKEPSPDTKPERIIPLPDLSSSSLETQPTTTIDAVNKARETLRILKLERQILGSAVTTIYESHSKGDISEAERDRMLEKYKVDLKRLEMGINENQRVVDLHDLEVARDQIIKEFKSKLAEIEARLKDLKSGSLPPQNPHRPSNNSQHNSDPASGDSSQGGDQSNRKETQEISDSEKRIVQIREEILKAMDRLEQIEAEG